MKKSIKKLKALQLNKVQTQTLKGGWFGGVEYLSSGLIAEDTIKDDVLP